MPDNYDAVVESARQEFAQKNPMEMARLSGAAFSHFPPLSWREFTLPFLGRVYRVLWPTGEVLLYSSNKEAPAAITLVLLHYLTKSTGNPPAGKWLPFNHLHGGNNYFAAFKKRSLDPLAGFFGNKDGLFAEIMADRLNARPGKEPQSHVFMALPRLPMLARLEAGDREIPPRAILLFDAVANEYLPTEDLAVASEILTGRLLAWGKAAK